MSEKPLISVIISTYNRAQLLPRAIKSVLGQTYQNIELIVVNDCSKDNTDDVVATFNDPRLIYLRHQENKGGPAARNTGAKSAKGVFVAFLDDDDEWLPTKLELEHHKFSESSNAVGVVYSGAEVRKNQNDALCKVSIPKYKGDLRHELLYGSVLGSVSYALIRRECLEKVNYFDETLKSCQDWDLWKRISAFYVFDYLPQALTRTYLHEYQISTNIDAVIQGRIQILNKYRQEFKESPRIYAIHQKSIGKFYCLKGNFKEARTRFKECIKVNPWNVFMIFLWLLVEFPIIKSKGRYRL